MMLAMYWLDIWTKPRLYLTPLDELALAAEIVVVVAVFCAVVFVWMVARDEKRKSKQTIQPGVERTLKDIAKSPTFPGRWHVDR
jgi:hypothetical protein